jgi:hypothetical protein
MPQANQKNDTILRNSDVKSNFVVIDSGFRAALDLRS